MRRLCVFCGSNPGNRPAFVEGAVALGRALVAQRCGLVYGGGASGMMGAVASAVLEAGGEAIGVVPEGVFGPEHLHRGLTDVRTVRGLAERKALMTELSQGFLALPGGVGTLDELFEVWAGLQLGLQPNPIGLLNTAGYYDALLAFLDSAVGSGYIAKPHRDLLTVQADPGALVSGVLNRSPGDHGDLRSAGSPHQIRSTP